MDAEWRRSQDIFCDTFIVAEVVFVNVSNVKGRPPGYQANLNVGEKSRGY